jgi:glycosyltransferase involved in cell wall biosynthesis
MPPPDVTLIVTTYQMPGHLRLALESIACQRTTRRLEVVVADDGSGDETPQVVAQFAQRAPFPVKWFTHAHAGYHVSRCRNAGARAASAQHLLFFDGDCILPPEHIETHLRAYRPGCVTSGYCVRLPEATSRQFTVDCVRRGDFQRLAPVSELRRLRLLHWKAWWYTLIGHPTKPAFRSTDFSLARSDFERCNGFDERFRGWGGEDDDLGRRFRTAGLQFISMLNRTRVYHLWHPPATSKAARWRDGSNIAYLHRPIRLTRCVAGLVPRTRRDLTVRLAGEAADRGAVAELVRRQGWHVECDPAAQADLELLACPGAGRFQGRGDCRVVAHLDNSAELPRAARKAHVVLSLDGAVGRADQVRLRLTDAAGLWQALSAGRICSPSEQGRIATPSYGFVPRAA